MPIITRIPSRSTIRFWILKFGLYKLTKPKEIADDWAVIFDHTIQMGKVKILIVLGLRLSNLPFNRSLDLADVQVLTLLPMKSSTGPKIKEVLINLKQEIGVIREVVADEGPDIKSGINLYRESNVECDYISDIVHKLAHFLHSELKNNISWEMLLKKSSLTRTKLLQTDYAEFIPPQHRDKARYLNLEKFIKWAIRILIAFQSDQISIKDKETLFKEFSWVLGLEDDVKYFHLLWQVTSICRDFIRIYGIQTDTAVILSRKLQELNLDFRSQIFADKIIQFISEQSVKAGPYERLLGSSEIIESLIGLVKHHSNTQSRSGFTSSILMAATLTGEMDEQTVLNSMINIKIADLKEWEKTYFDSTVQKKQAKFYQQTPLSMYADIEKSGTENRTCFTVDFKPEFC
jgi:hypothetical protein